jgi:peptidoglycan/xylan/chitin deacetylase (PgdA/CDA1 family)
MGRLVVAAKRALQSLNGVAAVAEYLVHGARPRPGLVILLYHRISADLPRWPPFDPYNVHPATFRRQISRLRTVPGVTVISVGRIVEWLASAPPRDGSFVAVTLDDGWRHMVPLLSEAPIREVPMTVFVPTGHIGREYFGFFRFDRWFVTADGRQAPITPLTGEDCHDLLAAGIEVQPHGHTHRSLGNHNDEALAAEIDQCVAALDRGFGVRAVAFAYPYGTARFGDCTPRVERALDERGIQVAMRSEAGINRLAELRRERLRLRRVAVSEADVGLILAAKASGYLGFLPRLVAGLHWFRRVVGAGPTSR